MVLIYTLDTLIPLYFEDGSKKKFLAYAPVPLFAYKIQNYYQKICHPNTKGDNCFKFIHTFTQNDSNQVL